MIDKLANANLIAKVIALSCFALVTAAILAIPAAQLESYFFPPGDFFGTPPPIQLVLFPFGLTFSIPFSFGLYGALGFWKQRKILLFFLVIPIVALYLFWQWPNRELLVQIVSLQMLALFLGVVPGFLLRFSYLKLKR